MIGDLRDRMLRLAILDGAQALARTLGAMLDDARLAVAESPGCLTLHDRAAQ